MRKRRRNEERDITKSNQERKTNKQKKSEYIKVLPDEAREKWGDGERGGGIIQPWPASVLKCKSGVWARERRWACAGGDFCRVTFTSD